MYERPCDGGGGEGGERAKTKISEIDWARPLRLSPSALPTRTRPPRAKSILNATGLRRDVSAQSTFFGDVVGQRLGGRRLNGDPGWWFQAAYINAPNDGPGDQTAN